MNYFVVATRKAGSSESEITHYKYYTSMNSTTVIKSKEDLWNTVKATYRNDMFYSRNLLLNSSVICEWRQINEGQPFLKSDPNGTRKDNLLSLPAC